MKTQQDIKIILESPEEKLQQRIREAESRFRERIKLQKERDIMSKQEARDYILATRRRRHIAVYQDSMITLARKWFKIPPNFEDIAELSAMDKFVAVRAKKFLGSFALLYGTLFSTLLWAPHVAQVLIPCSMLSLPFVFLRLETNLDIVFREPFLCAIRFFRHRKYFWRAKRAELLKNTESSM